MSARLCPDDGSTLRNVADRSASFGICDHCHGLWLSDSIVRECIRTRSTPVLLPAKRVITQLPGTQRLCPDCPGSVLQTSVKSAVQIDVCSRCRGVWFDAGEIELLIRNARVTATSTAGSSLLLERADASTEAVEIIADVLLDFGPSVIELGAHTAKAAAESVIDIISSVW